MKKGGGGGGKNCQGNQKIVQFKFIFHSLFHGHLMLEYETMYDLFANLKVLNNWSNSAG